MVDVPAMVLTALMTMSAILERSRSPCWSSWVSSFNCPKESCGRQRPSPIRSKSLSFRVGIGLVRNIPVTDDLEFFIFCAS